MRQEKSEYRSALNHVAMTTEIPGSTNLILSTLCACQSQVLLMDKT